MTTSKVVLTSFSAALDGGFAAIADVSAAIATGAADDERPISGVTVMLRIGRLRLDLPVRATGDRLQVPMQRWWGGLGHGRP